MCENGSNGFYGRDPRWFRVAKILSVADLHAGKSTAGSKGPWEFTPGTDDKRASIVPTQMSVYTSAVWFIAVKIVGYFRGRTRGAVAAAVGGFLSESRIN